MASLVIDSKYWSKKEFTDIFKVNYHERKQYLIDKKADMDKIKNLYELMNDY